MKTTLGFLFYNNFYHFSCAIEYNGHRNYWTELVTENKAKELSKQFDIELPEKINNTKTIKVF